MVTYLSSVIEVSRTIWEGSEKEAEYFPIDRHFVEKHLDEILALPADQFILYNAHQFPEIYTGHLFLCLPELWEKISTADLLIIADKIENNIARYTFIKFLATYLEVDIASYFLSSPEISNNEKSDIIGYLKLYWGLFFDEAHEGNEDDNKERLNYFKFDYAHWQKLKQKFTENTLIKALPSEKKPFYDYIYKIISNYEK